MQTTEFPQDLAGLKALAAQLTSEIGDLMKQVEAARAERAELMSLAAEAIEMGNRLLA